MELKRCGDNNGHGSSNGMSRGHGRVERVILKGQYCFGASAKQLVYAVRAAGEEEPQTVYDRRLRETIGGKFQELKRSASPRPVRMPPTRSELESVRRALRNLRKQGLVLPPIKIHNVIYERPGRKATRRRSRRRDHRP